MKPEYQPKTIAQVVGYAVEELGELQHALGKTLRWGPFSANPELPPGRQESNLLWVRRELKDVRRALAWLDAAMEQIAESGDERLAQVFDVSQVFPSQERGRGEG